MLTNKSHTLYIIRQYQNDVNTPLVLCCTLYVSYKT